MSKENNLPILTLDEVTKAGVSCMNENQLSYLFKKTPEQHIYKRPAKGGGEWHYVTGVYVKKVLNLMFGFDWSFEVVEHKFDLQIKQAYVLGKLTVNSGGKSIVKMQFGRVDIKCRKSDGLPLDIGNDLKAATTDALKKCASELGIASDVYAPNEFKEIKVVAPSEKEEINQEKKQEIESLLEVDGIMITEEERLNICRIIEEEETIKYNTCLKLLKSKLPKTK